MIEFVAVHWTRCIQRQLNMTAMYGIHNILRISSTPLTICHNIYCLEHITTYFHSSRV